MSEKIQALIQKKESRPLGFKTASGRFDYRKRITLQRNQCLCQERQTSNVTSKIGQNHCLHGQWCRMCAATVGHSPPPGFTLISSEQEGGHYGWTLAASQAPAQQDLSPVNSRALPQGDFLSVRSPTSSDTRWVMQCLRQRSRKGAESYRGVKVNACRSISLPQPKELELQLL